MTSTSASQRRDTNGDVIPSTVAAIKTALLGLGGSTDLATIGDVEGGSGRTINTAVHSVSGPLDVTQVSVDQYTTIAVTADIDGFTDNMDNGELLRVVLENNDGTDHAIDLSGVRTMASAIGFLPSTTLGARGVIAALFEKVGGVVYGKEFIEFDAPLNVLFVVSNTGTPAATDSALKAHMESVGHVVTYRASTDAQAAIGTYDVAVLSSSPTPSDYAAKYTNEFDLPTVNLEGFAWDDHDLATGDPIASDIDAITVVSSTALSGGLSGGTTMYTSTDGIHAIASANHDASAIVGATFGGNSVVYGHEVGDTLEGGGTALHRRVAFGVYNTDVLTDDAKTLFNTALAWAAASA